MLYGLDDIRMRRLFIEEVDDAAHKRREHKRLDLLIAYCESPECRRQALLAYFGEDTAPCGNCDVCEDPPVVEDGTLAAQKALSAVHRTGQRFGAAHLIDVLRGADTEKVRAAGHDRLPTYGAGGDIAKEAWRSILRQLVATGFLQLDVKGHGGLSITARGRELLSGEETFRYRKDTLPAAKKAAPKRGSPQAELSDSDNALFHALKEQRLTLARERGVPAYVIFPDKALADMARRKPASEAEFAQIHGVGAAKLRDFATPFLTAIAKFSVEAG